MAICQVGGILPLPFDFSNGALLFVPAVLGYLSMNKEQLDFAVQFTYRRVNEPYNDQRSASLSIGS
jgi:hypothetical protein